VASTHRVVYLFGRWGAVHTDFSVGGQGAAKRQLSRTRRAKFQKAASILVARNDAYADDKITF
jgi:hypothetical protein